MYVFFLLFFLHAREAVYGVSKYTVCENFSLKTLRSRLEVFERESSMFPRHAPEASAAFHESATWGSDVELGAMAMDGPRPFSPSLTRARARKFGGWIHARLPIISLSRATEKHSIDWPDEPRESQSSKLDERFLSGPNSRPGWRKLQFFSDLHLQILETAFFFFHLTNAAAADFTNLVGSVEQGYTAIPVIEDTLASHLSPSLAPSWKSRPLLPTKPCRTTSAVIGKSYIAAIQAGMALHTIAILQGYQADVLKEIVEGAGLTPEAVKELRKATD